MKTLYRIWIVLALVGLAALGVVYWQRGAPDVFIGERARSEREIRRRLAERLPAAREAEIKVLEVVSGDGDSPPFLRFEWREVKPDDPAEFFAARQFSICGVEPRFEALVLTFAEDRSDPLSGKSLVLFRRVYGEKTAPEDGASFADPTRPVPETYAVADDLARYERDLWVRFWNLATDPAAAAEAGVAVALAKAVSRPLTPGARYRIVVTIDGRMDLVGPLD